MKKGLLKFGVVVIMVVVSLPAFVWADVFMKEKQHTDGMTIMGQAQPPQDKIVTVWVAKDKMRRDMGEMSSIVLLDGDKILIYHLNHNLKNYTVLSIGSGDLQETVAAMTGEVKMKITPTGESKKIGNWTCKKYLQEMDLGMMPMSSEIWASEDIKIPHQELYEKLSTAMMAQQPGMKAALKAMEEERKKLKGVPVLTTTTATMMKNTTMKTSMELMEIKEGTAPAGSFEIPPGYSKQEMPAGFGERKMPGKQKPKLPQ
jgi:hypothetical protein